MEKAEKDRKAGFRSTKKTIKKPKYIYEFLKYGAICLVIALGLSWFMLSKKIDSINQDYEDDYLSKRKEVESSIMDLTVYTDDNPRYAKLLNTLEKNMYDLAAVYGTGKAEVWIKGEKALETPRGIVAWVGYNEGGLDSSGRFNPNLTEYYFLEDESYLSPIQEKYPLVVSDSNSHDAFASFFGKNDQSGETEYYYSIEQVMINRETHRFIPEIVSVYSVYSLRSEGSVAPETFYCSSSVPEGFESVPADKICSSMLGYVPKEETDLELTQSLQWPLLKDSQSDANAPMYCELRYSGYQKHTLSGTLPYETAVFMGGAVIIGLLCGLVISVFPYNRKKGIWEAYEYRKKTTEAMAHDLKTPLSTISAYAESMEGATPEQNTEYSEMIRKNVSEMNRMVENILNFSKSENASQTLTKKEVNVGNLVNASVSKFRGLFDQNQLRTNVTCSEECVLTTDEQLFRQAMENLISNCAKYATPGSEVAISVSGKKVSFRNQTTGKFEDVDSLKKPFVKGEGARGENGTGLGLSIADNNLSLLGYKLELKAENGWFETLVILG